MRRSLQEVPRFDSLDSIHSIRFIEQSYREQTTKKLVNVPPTRSQRASADAFSISLLYTIDPIVTLLLSASIEGVAEGLAEGLAEEVVVRGQRRDSQEWPLE